MVCVEFVKDKATKALFDEELDIGKRVANEADKRGLIVRPIVHLNIMSPPLTMTKDDVDFIVATLHSRLDVLDREGVEGRATPRHEAAPPRGHPRR